MVESVTGGRFAVLRDLLLVGRIFCELPEYHEVNNIEDSDGYNPRITESYWRIKCLGPLRPKGQPPNESSAFPR